MNNISRRHFIRKAAMTGPVLAPVLDSVVATRFRKEKMKWDLNLEATRRMLTEFGYGESDLPAGGKWIEA